jgi:hypothetical protein
VHHGPVVRQEMLGSVELVGPEVIVVHRLLKNSIVATHSLDAFGFFTDACLADTTLDPRALGMLRHLERYDDVGEIAGWVHDLDGGVARRRRGGPCPRGPGGRTLVE